MRHLKWLLPFLLLAGGGGYALYHFVLRTPPTSTVSTGGAPIVRDSIQVPEVRFTDVTGPAGIKFRHVTGAVGEKFLPETMGGGVAAFDYDRDDKQDLLFINSCPWPGHENANATMQLYRNKGDGTFEDVTAKVGLNIPMYGMGVAVGDYDNDGYSDVFVSCVGKHHLFHNDGGKKFTDVTGAAGVSGTGSWPKCTWEDFSRYDSPIPFGSSATFVDYDGDAKLDLFVCMYVTWSPAIDKKIMPVLQNKRTFGKPTEYNGTLCLLYRNVDGQRFENVSKSAGVEVTVPDGIGPKAVLRPAAKALGVIICDPDDDGWPDLLIANDSVRNFFFHNVPGKDGKRVFEEKAEYCNAAYADTGTARGGMGIDWGEYRTGMRAAIIANFAFEPNTFLRQSGPKSIRFADAAIPVGISGPSRKFLKFGAFFFDYDLDGRLDLLTANGHIEPDIKVISAEQTYEQPAQLFWNTGRDSPVYEPVPVEQTGPDLFKPLVGRGSAYLDYDGDGDLDVVLVGNGGPALLMRNDNKLGHKWVRLQLEGDGLKVNRSAIGAEITIEAGGQTYRRSVAGARGYLSQSEFPVTVGLGTTTKVDKVTVRWPGKDAGAPQVWMNLDAGKTYQLKYGDTQAR